MEKYASYIISNYWDYGTTIKKYTNVFNNMPADSFTLEELNKCTCKIALNKSLCFVDCKLRKLRAIPLHVPDFTTHLDLSYNKLTEITNGSFLHVRNLIFLNLNGNYLTNIATNAFVGLTKLQALDISNNDFKRQQSTPELFHLLSSLQFLDVTYNLQKEEEYIVSALEGLEQLKELRVTLPDKVGFSLPRLRNLVQLTVVQINYAVHKDFFALLGDTLEYISLQSIRYIEEGAFSNLSTLRMLDLSKSWFQAAENTATLIRNLSGIQVEILYLNNTGLIDDTPSFLQLEAPNLRVLSIDNNKMFELPCWYDLFKNTIEELSITNNFISDIIVALLSTIFYEMPSLQFVNFSHQIFDATTTTWIDPIEGSMDLPQNLSKLDLSYTKLSISKWSSKKVVQFAENNSLEEVNLAGTGTTSLKRQIIICNADVKLKIKSLNLNNNDLGCIKTDFFTFCDWSALNELKLSNNKLGYHEDNTCEKETGVGVLDFLKPLWNLTHLELNGNVMLRKLASPFLSQQVHLRKLYMSRMALTSFNITIKHMKSLHLLDVSANKIPCLFIPQIRDINEIINYRPGKKNVSKEFIIDFTFNPLQCNCQCLDFYKWIKKVRNHITFKNLNHYHCMFANGNQVSLSQMEVIIKTLKSQCISTDWSPVIVELSFLVSFYLFITVAATLFRFRHTLKYIWLKHKMHREYLENHIMETKYIYDGFVSCDRRDAIWVKRNLLPKLETKETGIKFCVAQRDFLVGATIIDNIVHSINKSRKVIFIVSKHFIKSGWCQEELLISHNESLSRGKNILICIFMPDIIHSQLSDRFRFILNHVTCIKWPCDPAAQQVFWIMLHKALLDGNIRKCHTAMVV